MQLALYEKEASAQVIARISAEKETLVSELESTRELLKAKQEELDQANILENEQTLNTVQHPQNATASDYSPGSDNAVVAQEEEVKRQVEAAPESTQAFLPASLSSELIDEMNQLSDQLIDQRSSKKAPLCYPQREHMSQLREPLNGTLRIC